jgi:hypothetical protein
MNWDSKSTIANRLTKPPTNVHSCCNLVRTDANSSGVGATEGPSYKMKDAKALLRQDTVVVVVCSSFGLEPVVPSPRTGGPPDMLEQFIRLNWEQGGFMALWVMLTLLSEQ